VCESGAEESVMLGVRWCLIVQRPGLSYCDWVHPQLRKGQGQSEKLKTHNQVFKAYRRARSAFRQLGAMCDEAV